MHPVMALAAFGFMGTAAVSDLRRRRISNRLNVAGASLALVLQLVLGGLDGVLYGVQGLLTGLGFLFIPFAAGLVGGGDVKFAAAVGAFFGWRLLLVGLVAGVILGGVVGAASLAKHGRFRSAFSGLFADLLCLSSGVRPTTLKNTDAVETVPYGVLLAMGLAASLAVTLFKEVPWVSQ